jgi:rhodanese-related sulfurtransferase
MSTLDAHGLPAGYPYRAADETTPRELDALRRAELATGHSEGDPKRQPPTVLLDVRTQSEWDICRIEGARLLPLQEIDQRIDELKAELNDDLGRRIVVNCHHGRRSLTATYILRAAGFTNVTSLAGGIHLWAQDIDRGMPKY